MLRRRSDDGGPLTQPEAVVSACELAEQHLIGQVAARQVLAFEALYRSYHPRLTRFLDRMTRRPELVDEVLNDTMFVVWNRADSFNGQCKVSTWIFAIAYRKALKALHRLDEPIDDENAEQRASSEPGPEQRVGQQQLHDALVCALDALSVEHRAVVELTYFHDAGYREIAQIVDCPVDTVKTRMFHARRRLKILLSGGVGDWL
jgi:RNA polymerase sigma factor (sigma-70 family)